MSRFALAGVFLILGVAPVSALPPSNEKTLEHALEVLTDLGTIPLKDIPPKLLADAQGVAIVPRVVKAGFVVGGVALATGVAVILTAGPSKKKEAPARAWFVPAAGREGAGAMFGGAF